MRLARGIYRVAKSYVSTDLGHVVTPHVEEMKRTLQRPYANKKKAAPAEPPATTPEATLKPSDSTSQQKYGADFMMNRHPASTSKWRNGGIV